MSSAQVIFDWHKVSHGKEKRGIFGQVERLFCPCFIGLKRR